MGYTVYFQNGVVGDWNAYKKDIKFVLKTFKITDISKKALDQNGDFDWAVADAITDKGDPYTVSASVNCCAWIDDTDHSVNVYGPHESFNFEADKPQNFTFTKTARKSYDGLIKILYLVTQKHFQGEISHDGEDQDFLIECLDRISEFDQKAMNTCIGKLVLLNDHVIKWGELAQAV